MKNGKFAILLLLIFSNVFIYYVVFSSGTNNVTVSFLNIGQGDAIFIQTPSGKQILVDAGPNKTVLRELGKTMSFFDKSIDVVMESHPDKDHIGGFPEVLKQYEVGLFIEPRVACSTGICKELEKDVSLEKSQVLYARRGTVIDFGDGVLISILFPDRDVYDLETNTASIVARLTYGNNSLLLTGDSPQSIEDFLVWKDGINLDSDILKVGHHGSRTSSDQEFVRMVSPALSIISAGKGNSYGHPHKEVLDILTKEGSKILSTIVWAQ